MPRILSLIASSTEIVCALGFEGQLVGRSHECDFPTSVQSLPFCTEPKFNVDGTSAEIDQRVKSILQEALSVYRIDEIKLKELKPDIIITQSQCEVCAVSMSDVNKAVSGLIGSKPQIVSLEPNQLTDLWNDINLVSEALKVPNEGKKLVRELKQRIKNIEDEARKIVKKPTVACIEWIDPLMAAGNWMPELVELGGGINLFGESGKHSPWMNWDNLKESDPDIILILPCGYNIERTKSEMTPLIEKPDWFQLKAVKNRQVYITDGNQYFNRPGPRLVESLEIIAEILHPIYFNFSHENTGWELLDTKL